MSSELGDARDCIIQALRGPPRLLSERYIDLATADCAAENVVDEPLHDPSVRFFGLDWRDLFAKCFSLSLNVQVLRAQLTEAAANNPGASSANVDLVLLNSVLKEFSRIEVDVTSHGEAVLHGRLSKSQQMLIQREQLKYSALTPSASFVSTGGGGGNRVTKSRSFREPGVVAAAVSKKQRQMSRYKKTKTTDLHKLSSSSAPSEAERRELSAEWQEVMSKTKSQHEKLDESSAMTSTSMPGRKSSGSSSFMQNVTSIFKTIR